MYIYSVGRVTPRKAFARLSFIWLFCAVVLVVQSPMASATDEEAPGLQDLAVETYVSKHRVSPLRRLADC